MRHKIKRLQLNRFTSWRRATLKSMAQNLLTHQSIRTTKTKALAVKPMIDKLITLGKQNTLTAKRRAFDILGDHKLVSLLFSDIAQSFTDRSSGFSRIRILNRRRGDDAQLVILELTEIKKKEIIKPEVKTKEKEPVPEKKPQVPPEKEKPAEPKKPKKEAAVATEAKRPPIEKKPTKKFLGGLRKIFKRERDSL